MIRLPEDLAKRALSMRIVDGLSGSRVGRVGPSDRRPDRRQTYSASDIQWVKEITGENQFSLEYNNTSEVGNHAAVIPLFGSTNLDQRSWRLLCTTPSESIKNPENTSVMFILSSEKTNLTRIPCQPTPRPIQKDQLQWKRNCAHVVFLNTY
jgi:hypothetical protein